MGKNLLSRKWFALGIIFLFTGASALPNISGSIGKNTIHVRTSNTQTTADETITDWTGDVCSYNYDRTTWTIITNSTDIEVDNIDLIQTSFAQQDSQATLRLQVAGNIENRGYPGDTGNDTIDHVEYLFELTTSEQFYVLVYVNQTCVLFYDDNVVNLTSSDFTVLNNTLSITFPLMNLTETYENLNVTVLYIKANLSSQPSTIVLLSDTVPNKWAKVLLFGTYNSADLRGAYMALEAVRLWMVRFQPFQLTRFIPGDIIRISTPYKARMITNHFIIGMVDVLEF